MTGQECWPLLFYVLVLQWTGFSWGALLGASAISISGLHASLAPRLECWRGKKKNLSELIPEIFLVPCPRGICLLSSSTLQPSGRVSWWSMRARSAWNAFTHLAQLEMAHKNKGQELFCNLTVCQDGGCDMALSLCKTLPRGTGLGKGDRDLSVSFLTTASESTVTSKLNISLEKR